MSKGHGRIETRSIRTSADLVGYSAFPGLAQVAEITTHVVHGSTGEVTEGVHYLVTSLSPDHASPRRLLALMRGHWRIENSLFHVADDSFGEDRQVLQTHHAGCTLKSLALHRPQSPPRHV
jgi:Transposase DDE domain